MSEITVASTTDTQQAVELAAGLNTDRAGDTAEGAAEQNSASHAADYADDQEQNQEQAEQPDSEQDQAQDRESQSDGQKRQQPRKGGVQKRIDTLTRRIYEQQEELDSLRERVGERSEQQAAATQRDSRPVAASYRSYEEYIEALADWKAGQRYQQQKQAELVQVEQERTREVFDTYNQAAISAREKYEDFEEVVGRRDLKIPQAVQVAIIEAGDIGPDIAYYLGKHPDLCRELAKMSPMRAIARIGQIENQVTGERSQTTGYREQGRKPRINTSAPAPISPVGASSHRSTVPLGELPYRDYKRLRDQEERAGR